MVLSICIFPLDFFVYMLYMGEMLQLVITEDAFCTNDSVHIVIRHISVGQLRCFPDFNCIRSVVMTILV